MRKFKLMIAYPTPREKFVGKIFFTLKSDSDAFDIGAYEESTIAAVKKKQSNYAEISPDNEDVDLDVDVDDDEGPFKFEIQKPKVSNLKGRHELLVDNKKCLKVPDGLAAEDDDEVYEAYIYDEHKLTCIHVSLIDESLSDEIGFKTYNECIQTCANIVYQRYEFELRFQLPAGLKSELKLFAFMIDGQDLIVDQLNIDLVKESPCIENVNLKFNSSTVKPGQQVTMSLESEKNARCIMSAIDEGLTLLGPQNLLESNDVSFSYIFINEIDERKKIFTFFFL
jgi:hypothetical protein